MSAEESPIDGHYPNSTPLDAFQQRRDRPENISQHGNADTCWHCFNSVHMNHVKRCAYCGFKLNGPPIQDMPRCLECGAMWRCTRATRRPVDDRGRVLYDPETGEELAVRTFEDGSTVYRDPCTGEELDGLALLEECGLS